MTLLTDRPAVSDVWPDAAQEGPRRRARLLFPAVALAVALVVALGYALLPQLVRFDQQVTPLMPVDSGLLVPEYGDQGAFFLHYQHGATVTMHVPVVNRSLFPVTIRDVSTPGHERPLLERVGITGVPATLSPGEQVTVGLTFRFANCRYYHERSMESMDGVVVHGSGVGRAFTEPLGFERPLAVHGQVILDCPDRTLVRGDDRRR